MYICCGFVTGSAPCPHSLTAVMQFALLGVTTASRVAFTNRTVPTVGVHV